MICTTFLLFSYLFSFIDILAADRSVSFQQWSLYNDNAATRLDAVVESYYGPPIYDMSATDVTRKWLREAFREEIENYMKQEPGDTERQEDVSYDLTDYLYHLATDSTSQVNSVTSAERSYNRSVQRTNYGGDWSDEDVLLGYMIHK